MTFFDGTTAIDTATLVNGSASYTTAALTGGSHTIVAVYDGDSNFKGSDSPLLTQSVNPIASQTQVQSSENPAQYGDSVTFTVTVSTSSTGLDTPTGQVTFYDGSTSMGTETLSGGSASFSTSALAAGSH